MLSQRVRVHSVHLGPLQTSGLSLKDDSLCLPSTPQTGSSTPRLTQMQVGLFSRGSQCSQQNTALCLLLCLNVCDCPPPGGCGSHTATRVSCVSLSQPRVCRGSSHEEM